MGGDASQNVYTQTLKSPKNIKHIDSYSRVIKKPRVVELDGPISVTNTHYSTSALSENDKMVNHGFSGVWEIIKFDGENPAPRSAATTCYFPDEDKLYCVYGKDMKGKDLNDAWVLDFKKGKWKCLNSNFHSKRSDSSGIIYGHKLWIFGGSHNKKFLADLHNLDLRSGKCKIIHAPGKGPTPRANPVIAIKNNLLFVWGGFDGTCPSDIHVFNLLRKEWTITICSTPGRSSPSYAQVGDSIYIHGAAKTHGLLQYDFTTNQMSNIQTCGAEPLCTVQHSAMIHAHGYLFAFGGSCHEKSFTSLYAFDISLKWWIVFPVLPDFKTVSYDDGYISENGIFKLPRDRSFSAVYRKCKRQIYCLFGLRCCNSPVPVSVVEIGESLGVLNLMIDMIVSLG